MVDDLGDHALRDVGLAQPDLVGDEKAQSRIGGIEHPLEGPDRGTALEVLEAGERSLRVDVALGHRERPPATATS